MEDKYVGLALAVCSTLGIGASFVITKKGLNAAAETHGFEGDGFAYLRNPIWWAGIITMVVGEVCNFSAYAFAPAILVTPLGALSVLIGAVLGSYFLGEQLGILGRIGCAICLIGSVVIVLHAPADEEVEDIGTLLNYALQPGKISLLEEIACAYGLTNRYFRRLLILLHHRGCLRLRHDLQDRAGLWKEEPHDLHQHLFLCRLHLGHGHQRIWCCFEAITRRKQSILKPINIRLRNHGHRLHLDPDELL
jgi:hypothetical protein